MPETGRRPTHLIVDRGAISGNAAIIRAQISPTTRLMAVVKANGYGHGAIESARAALRGGASFLGVATVSEGRELRDAGIMEPVLVLGSSGPQEAPEALALHLALGVGDPEQIDRLLEVLEDFDAGNSLSVHLKIDTGMRRFGVTPDEAVTLAERLAEHTAVRLSGVYSHFAEADAEDESRLEEQLDLFRATVERIDALRIERGIAHISNSAALLRNRSCDFDMVRAGICLYGISPSEHVPLFEGMRPALEWRATVQHVTEMTTGDRTGYGGTYVATEHERIALIPIGYADGYPRHLSNKGWFGFRGRPLPIRGRISMDQCAVGIPADLALSVGDEITILGDERSGAPDANQLGALIDTIGYEIVARISRRVPVDYIFSGLQNS